MSHGGDIYKYAKILKCAPEEITDFSSNINLYQPAESFTCNAQSIAPYADFRYKNLKKAIAAEYGVEPKETALFNGATAAIYELFRTLKPKRVYMYAPIYSEYEKAAKLVDKAIFKISRLGDMEDDVVEKSIVVFVNPSTPDGTYYDEEEMEELFEMWSEKKCTILIDESFLEFEAHPSLRSKIKTYKKLYIIHSFSKFCSCAGVRIGAVFSNPKNIKKLHNIIWNISSLDAEFLEKRIQDGKFKTKTKQLHQQQKQELHEILEHSGLFEQIFESDANFYLTKSQHAAAIFNHLLEHKILVRRCFDFDYLDNAYLRFAVKDAQSQMQLKTQLETLAQKILQENDALS